LFSILFAVWALPETILVRNLCLSLGGCIGIYQAYYYRTFLASKKAIPIYLISALFIWITIHLLFLTSDFALQYTEYRSIWKRSFMGIIFALGFGLSIANVSSKARKGAWIIFYIGLLLPTLIFFLKFGLLYYEKISGADISPYWHIYIAKTAYMGFCTPVLAVALGQIYSGITRGKWLTWANLVYSFTIPAVLFVFYTENIKNGVLYSFLFILIFIGVVVYKYFKTAPVKIGLLMGALTLLSGILIKQHINANHSWQTFFADARVAIQVDNNDAWRVCGAPLGLPKNAMGEQVSDTNYSRIAWGINAAKLIIKYPLGYGLVERSFGHVGRKVWPDSCLSQSHSGWLDLTLGLGIPGIALILGAIVGCLRYLALTKLQFINGSDPWNSMLTWTLLCLLSIWVTTEISQKVFLDELLFFIALAGGFLAGMGQEGVYK
jgi:hypothetical protein